MRMCIYMVLTLLTAYQAASQNVVSDSVPKEKKIDFTVMPFASYNQNLKFMFGGIPMMMYRLNPDDTSSPKSLTGASAVYTTNNSYFLAFFNQIYFGEGRWRAKFFIMNGDKISQFYMDNGVDYADFYDYDSKITLVSGGLQRLIASHLFAGMSYTFAHYNTEYENNINPQSVSSTNSLEINAMYDSRDDVYYPKNGINAKLRWITFQEWMGNDMEANRIFLEYNTYFDMAQGRDVLAARLSGKYGLGDILFEQQQTIGGGKIFVDIAMEHIEVMGLWLCRPNIATISISIWGL
ncbi:MAG: BamA/TamA family outer membrane protein [Bacteroidales bacterium]